MSGMLFDTPGLNIPSVPIAAPSETPFAKRKRLAGPPSSEKKQGDVSINLDKLMKRMRKDDGWGKELGSGGKTGIEVSEKDEATRLRREGKKKAKAAEKASAVQNGTNTKGKETARAEGGQVGGKVPTPKVKAQRFDPAVNSKKHKKDKKATKAEAVAAAAVEAASWSPASSANFISVKSSYVGTTPEEIPEPRKAAKAFSAPNHEATDAGASTSAPQTAMQIALRAKLAGGRFRMLNETLYTSTGEEAGETMREEGAFVDYHAGFRSQSAHWPVHPLTILTTALEQLPTNSLIADFGCGDAALARSLVPQGLKVLSYDLVSKDAWVVECGCASVPLPGGGGQDSEIVDAVVCCLSLMGTDWVDIVREARRVLKDGGELKIAEVTSRFTNLDSFVSLICFIGFKLLHKDTTNTHFVMFDFEKVSGGEETSQRADTTKKAVGLLKPCIYKKR